MSNFSTGILEFVFPMLRFELIEIWGSYVSFCEDYCLLGWDMMQLPFSGLVVSSR